MGISRWKITKKKNLRGKGGSDSIALIGFLVKTGQGVETFITWRDGGG